MAQQKRNKPPVEISDFDKKTIEEIGEKIKKLRSKVETNHEVFAFKHGINRTTLYRLESGENFTINVLLKTLRALDITPEEFFKGIK